MFYETTHVLGIDLAWGLRSADAIAQIQICGERLTLGSLFYTHGDLQLIEHLTEKHSLAEVQTLLAIDAPLKCLNAKGSRPVDKECNALYRSYEAGCHPVNLALCPRPIALAQKLEDTGFTLDSDVRHKRLAIEVYPHPAMIEWFCLPKTIKYKRGKVAEKKKAFAFYQQCFQAWLKTSYPLVALHSDLERLLNEEWTKKNEDGLDAYLCAFIGAWHVQHSAQKSQILGDRKSGFMVIPTL